MEPESFGQSVARAVQVLSDSGPEAAAETILRAMASARKADIHRLDDGAALYDVLRSAAAFGLTEDVGAVLEKLRATAERVLGPKDPTTVDVASALAHHLMATGRQHEARKLLEPFSSALNLDCGSAARMHRLRSRAAYATGDGEGAEAALASAIDCARGCDDLRPEERVELDWALGMIRWGRQDLAGAQSALQKAVDGARALRAHPDLLASATHALSLVLAARGQLPLAAKLLDRTMASLPSSGLSSRPAVLSDRAGMHLVAGETRKAARAAEKALEAASAEWGPDDPRLGQLLAGVAAIQLELDGPKAAPEAEARLTRALGIQVSSLSETHPLVARTMQTLGRVARLQQNLAEATGLLARAAGLFRHHGLDLEAALTLRELAEVLAEGGDGAEAKEALREAARSAEEAGPQAAPLAAALAAARQVAAD